MQIAQAFPPVAQLQNSSPDPIGGLGRVYVHARARALHTCNDSALFPSAFPADFRCAVAHSCSRTPRFLLLISVANATRSSRALARCQSTIPRSHFRSRSGNEAKSILISFLFESLPLNLIHFFSYVLLLESMIDRSMERAFFFESSKNGYLIRVLEI